MRSRSQDRRSRSAGASLAEALLVLLLASVLLPGAWGLLAHQLRAARAVADTGERLEAARIGRHLLGGELRAARAGRDWLPPEGDSLALRAFRGTALPCSPDDLRDDEIRVRYRGLRRPDPAKDSLLLLRPDGAWEVRGIEAVGAETEGGPPCPIGGGRGTVERWRLSAATPEFVAGRLFERGSYHLARGSLRYRRGGGGRQPLTPAVLVEESSELGSAAGGGAIRIRLAFEGCARPVCTRPWEAVLRATAP